MEARRRGYRWIGPAEPLAAVGFHRRRVLARVFPGEHAALERRPWRHAEAHFERHRDQFTFDGPVWSVSAEVLVYGLFWLVLPRLFGMVVVGPLALSAIGLFFSHWAVANCAAYFFAGTAVYAVHRRATRALQLLLGVTGGLAAVTIVAFTGWVGPSAMVGFCSLVLLLALADEQGVGASARRIPWIADNCYGSYLWHVPFQIAVLIAVGRIGAPVFFSPAFLLFYLTGVTLLSRLSFVTFEKPMREWIRRQVDAPRVPPTRAP